MARGRILVVDDEAGMCQYLKKLLSDNMYDVETASNGVKALQRIEGFIPDLALIDYKMPKMDGLQLLRELKRRHHDMIVGVMTAYGTMDTAIQAMKLGAYDYVNKPFDMDEILLVID